MDQRQSRLLPSMSRVLRELLEDKGLSLRRASLATGHGPGWLAEMLNPERTPPLTMGAIEAVAKLVDIDPVDIIRRAFPDPQTSTDAYNLLHFNHPQEPDQHLDEEVKEALDELMARPVHVTRVDADLDLPLIESIADSVWHDRPSAYQYAFFHVDDLLSRPRKVHTLTMAFALLAEILRSVRPSDNYYRARLLVRAYELERRYPHRRVRALLDERVAYLLWNVVSDAGLASRILELPELIQHPYPVRLWMARANYQHVLGNHDIADYQLQVAQGLSSENPILQSLIQNMLACTWIHRGDYRQAESAIKKALDVRAAPKDVRLNNLAVFAKIKLHQEDKSEALRILVDLVNSPYAVRWPDKAVYSALDLFTAAQECSHVYSRSTLQSLVDLERRLLPHHPVEGELKKTLQQGIAAANSTRLIAIQRRLGDPNG